MPKRPPCAGARASTTAFNTHQGVVPDWVRRDMDARRHQSDWGRLGVVTAVGRDNLPGLDTCLGVCDPNGAWIEWTDHGPGTLRSGVPFFAPYTRNVRQHVLGRDAYYAPCFGRKAGWDDRKTQCRKLFDEGTVQLFPYEPPFWNAPALRNMNTSKPEWPDGEEYTAGEPPVCAWCQGAGDLWNHADYGIRMLAEESPDQYVERRNRARRQESARSLPAGPSQVDRFDRMRGRAGGRPAADSPALRSDSASASSFSARTSKRGDPLLHRM